MTQAESNKKYYDTNRLKLLEELKKKRATFSKKKWARIKELGRLANRKRLYNLSEEQYQKKLSNQGNKCAICRIKMSKPGVDHNRACCNREGSCGKCVRGILCSNCNSILGFAKDSIKNLRNAIEYLKGYKQ
jgi:hypothetical protein